CPRTLVATRRPVIDITVDRHHYLLTQYARCGSALTARRCVNCMPPEPRNSALPDQDGLLTRAASSVSSTYRGSSTVNAGCSGMAKLVAPVLVEPVAVTLRASSTVTPSTRIRTAKSLP